MPSRDKPDAIALLKADHRKVEDLFEKFEKARDEDRKKTLVAADLHRADRPCHDRGRDLLSGLQGQDRGRGSARGSLCRA